MSNIKDYILSSKVGRTLALVLAVYGVMWGIVEPLNLDIIEKHKTGWQIALPSLSALVAAVLSIRLKSRILEKLSTDSIDRAMHNSFSSTGNPFVTVQVDGQLGNVMSIKGQYHKDEMDWPLRSASQSARYLEIVFKNNKVFYFYLRVSLVSKNGLAPTVRWLRFDNSIVTPDIFQNDTHEMAIGYDCDMIGTYNKATIDIHDAVAKTYGQAGWVYQKATIFRIRCDDAMIGYVALKK